MIKLLICGVGGKMGANLVELLKDDTEARICCGVDVRDAGFNFPVYASFSDVAEKPDAIIDFSSPDVIYDELEYAKKNGVPVVIASTGFSEEHLKAIDEAAECIPVFRTGNFSLGINLLCELVKKAADTLGDGFDVEIIEKHHNLKKDAPSGTALMLADSVNGAFDGEKQCLYGRHGIVGKRGKEIGIHAVRGGTIVGEHEVMFCGEDEIVTLSHSARSKRVFAVGAIRAAKWIKGKPCGKYDMKDLLKDIL